MDKKQVYCRYCGRLIDEDAPFCTYCGKPQGDVRQGLSSIKRKTKQYMDFLASIILSTLGLLCLPFKKIVNIRFSNAQKDKFRRVKRVVLRYSVIIIIIGIVVGGGIAGYSYYYDEYLPQKYEEEAYYEIINKFNASNDATKLDLAMKICQPYYPWEKEYPKIEEGRMPVLLQYEDKTTKDGYCGKACDFIIAKAKGGNAKAQFLYGVILLGGKHSCWLSDTTRAVYWFNESAKNGFPQAYGEIGTAYEQGIGVSCNPIKAVELFKKGAKLNDPKSQYKLGCMYRDGISVESGWHWETKSTTEYMSDKDNVIREYWDSQRCTSVYIYREKVTDYETLVPKDINKAKYWWTKASAQGYTDASYSLQQVYD